MEKKTGNLPGSAPGFFFPSYSHHQKPHKRTRLPVLYGAVKRYRGAQKNPSWRFNPWPPIDAHEAEFRESRFSNLRQEAGTTKRNPTGVVGQGQGWRGAGILWWTTTRRHIPSAFKGHRFASFSRFKVVDGHNFGTMRPKAHR